MTSVSMPVYDRRENAVRFLFARLYSLQLLKCIRFRDLELSAGLPISFFHVRNKILQILGNC